MTILVPLVLAVTAQGPGPWRSGPSTSSAKAPGDIHLISGAPKRAWAL